ncbi:MAG TPA: type II CAAX endopeptidase family protein [Polyangiaceae bacterium]|nr:type II CAAX endopeptidase family protein [Polyangiaceae bacterium]
MLVLAALAVPRFSRRPSAPPVRIPSPLQAAVLWLFAMVLVFVANVAVSAIAAAVAIGTGLPVERAFELLSDSKSSPLVTSPTWIAISVLASELVLAALVWRFLRRHRVFLHEVAPLGVPSLRDMAGALLCVFGLAPLSGLVAELVRRALPRELNAETMVVGLTKGVTAGELVGVVLAAALVPAIVEELLFRGVLTRAWVGRSNLLALMLPSAMFGIFHVEPTQAAGTFVLGVGFGITRLYTDSVLTSILCHLAYGAYVLIDVYAGGEVGSTELHLGRVGFGLAVSAFGFLLMVLHPGERRR